MAMDGMLGGQQMMGPQSNSADMMQNLPESRLNPEDLAYQPTISGGYGEEESYEEEQQENFIDFALSETNLAKGLKNKKLKDGTPLLEKIADQVFEGYEKDCTSRQPWLDANKEWLKIAMLVRENKNFPWPNASNIKYPLLATAAMQFSARAYPALVPADGKVVKAKVIPYDKDGTLTQKAERIAKHMSYQVMCKIPNWEQEMDKLLMTMAISGICFKKTYHNRLFDSHISQIVYPENFVVNYYAKSLEKAYRKTEILYYTANEVLEKEQNDEEFLKLDLPEPTNPPAEEQTSEHQTTPPVDGSTPHVFLAQHTFYDLDNDGYEEPYVITIHRDSKKVVRITARFDEDGVHKDDKGKIVSIEPVEYFTAFPFIPNPDGSIYALGFGTLLGPINESVNTIVNQLVDSGTLSNLQSGFIGKGLRVKMGQNGIAPGEWKAVNATGDDLRKQIVPLPTKEPSAVLMNLLQLLISSGKELASIADIFTGKLPGQNTPATTTQESIQQGMAVFTAIYKRVYRSLHEEFLKLFRLNRITPGIAAQEAEYCGIPELTESDYDDDGLIVPGADPSGDATSTKMNKIQAVGQLLQMGTIDPHAYTRWALEALEVPNFEQLIAQPQPPQPDPKVETERMKQETMAMKAQNDAQLQQQKIETERVLAELKIQLKQKEMQLKEMEMKMDMQAKQQEHQMNQVMQSEQMQMDRVQMQHDMMANQAKTQLEMQTAQQEAKMGLEASKQQHKQKLQQGEESHKAKMQQTKQAAAAKPKPKGK